MSDMRVSVVSLVYNHEPYLRQCLEGFAMQKCSFPYEVIIHDDASTDGSAEIIREYAERYPDIIKPIYQKENQFSQRVKIAKTFIYPRVQGEYIAFCEGDDCWTDQYKLQKQVEFLDNHPQASACVHAATQIIMSTGKEFVFPYVLETRKYSIEEVVMGGGNLFATSSLVIRKDVLFQKPPCFEQKGVGDYQMFVYSAIAGELWCLADVMSVYRSGVTGSWTDRVWKNPKKREESFFQKIEMLQAVDKYYEGKYDVFQEKILETEMQIHLLNKNKKALKETCYRPLLKRYRRGRFNALVTKMFPFLRKWKKKRDLFRDKQRDKT